MSPGSVRRDARARGNMCGKSQGGHLVVFDEMQGLGVICVARARGVTW